MRNRNSGSALILSLWALLLLSAAIFAWVRLIDQDLAISTEANAGLDAQAFAHSGVAVALNSGVTQLTPLLEKQFSPGRGYKVKLTGEAGKMNLNWIFGPSAGGQPAPNAPERIAMFKRYLERRGVPFEDRQKLVDCMLDWIDLDNLSRLNGAEDEGDYHPPNRGRFFSLDEIEQIKNSKPLTSLPGWKDDFTVLSQPGMIDLQWAPLSVLQVLPNVDYARAQRFLVVRQGPDKIDGTKDDHIFKDMAEASSYLGMNSVAAKTLSDFLIFKDQNVHILSVGQSGKVHRQVEVVAQKVHAQPVILWWKE